eukprot:CAMPEP_0197438754 /NCGR_PEP_ID=MMETSP1175-20131217/5665_1 /TAXON_ID=1003142 /ORGANISM="Triceratium dubium, Strain CCMP147" /LENGTH=980 /DNA_ID=CAMNT_0042968549 /DNA_START=108 /DNA_END=3050 /DNA_ORIENTATION=-
MGLWTTFLHVALCLTTHRALPGVLGGAAGNETDGGHLPWSHYDDLRASASPGSNAGRRSDVVHVEGIDPHTRETRAYEMRHFAAMIALEAGGEGDDNKPIVINELATALLALKHFNEGIGDVIPEISEVSQRCDVKFTMEFFDTRQSPFVASQAYINDILPREGDDEDKGNDASDHASRQRPYPTALIGASRSAVSAPLAILSGVHDMPQVSFASTSVVFDNKDQFPLFGRLIPSAYGDANAAVSYLSQRLGVTHLGVLFVRDEYGSTYAQMLQDAAKESSSSLQIGTLSSFAFDNSECEISAAVRQLADSGLRYFFAVIFTSHVPAVMAEAHRQGIAGPGYYWIFGDGVSGTLTFDAETESDVIRAVEGGALLTISRPSIRKGRPEYEAFMRHWSNMVTSEDGTAYILSKLPWKKGDGHDGNSSGNSQTSAPADERMELRELGPFDFLFYDAVVALAMAACDAAEENRYFNGQEFYSSFLRMAFDGVYGSVVIDPKTGSRLYSSVPYSISNYVVEPMDEKGVVTVKARATDVQEQSTWAPVTGSRSDQGAGGSFTGDGGVFWRSIEPFIFSDGSTEPPAVLPDLIKSVDIVGHGAQIFGYVLSFIAIGLSNGFGLWSFFNRDNIIVLSSQPLFLGMLCVGALLIGVAIIPMSMQEEISQSWGGDAACMLTPWVFTFGFISGFSGLFSKAVLVNKINRSRDQRGRVAVKVRDVLKPFVFLFAANVAVLISWTIISPLTYRYVMTSSVDKFGRSNEFYGTCTVSRSAGWHDKVFPIVWGSINLGALLYANFQAYNGRYIITEYSESFYVGISMAILLQAVIIGTPVMLIMDNSPTAKFVVQCCLLFVTALALLLPIFVPKMVFLHRWRAREKKIERKLILTLKKERQMDALAIGDISASSWYLHRMEGSCPESLGTDGSNIGLRILASGKVSSVPNVVETLPKEGQAQENNGDENPSIGSICRRLSMEHRARKERMYSRAK